MPIPKSIQISFFSSTKLYHGFSIVDDPFHVVFPHRKLLCPKPPAVPSWAQKKYFKEIYTAALLHFGVWIISKRNPCSSNDRPKPRSNMVHLEPAEITCGARYIWQLRDAPGSLRKRWTTAVQLRSSWTSKWEVHQSTSDEKFWPFWPYVYLLVVEGVSNSKSTDIVVDLRSPCTALQGHFEHCPPIWNRMED